MRKKLLASLDFDSPVFTTLWYDEYTLLVGGGGGAGKTGRENFISVYIREEKQKGMVETDKKTYKDELVKKINRYGDNILVITSVKSYIYSINDDNKLDFVGTPINFSNGMKSVAFSDEFVYTIEKDNKILLHKIVDGKVDSIQIAHEVENPEILCLMTDINHKEKGEGTFLTIGTTSGEVYFIDKSLKITTIETIRCEGPVKFIISGNSDNYEINTNNILISGSTGPVYVSEISYTPTGVIVEPSIFTANNKNGPDLSCIIKGPEFAEPENKTIGIDMSGDTIVFLSLTGVVKILRFGNRVGSFKVKDKDGLYTGISLSPYGEYVSITTATGKVYVFKVKYNGILGSLKGENGSYALRGLLTVLFTILLVVFLIYSLSKRSPPKMVQKFIFSTQKDEWPTYGKFRTFMDKILRKPGAKKDIIDIKTGPLLGAENPNIKPKQEEDTINDI